MSPTIDPSDDLEAAADHLQAVTLLKPGGKQTPVAAALGRKLQVREAPPSAGAVTQADMVWHLPTRLVPQEPPLGSCIIDEQGRRWTVLTVAEQTLGSRWRCTARDLQVAFGLNNRITVQHATFRKNAHGAAVARWSTRKADVPARIEALQVQPQIAHHARVDGATHIVLIADDIELTSRDRIVDRRRVIYKIRHVAKAAALGEVTKVEVVRTVAPLA